MAPLQGWWGCLAFASPGRCPGLENFSPSGWGARYSSGPDEMHRAAIAKWELGKYGAYGRDTQPAVTRGG